MSVLPKGSLVLVTGVNGYIASHVASQLIAAGYKVRGTVRSRDKAQYLIDYFDNKYGKDTLEVIEVSDMTADGAFDEAAKGVSGICHLASVLPSSLDPNVVIAPVVKATVSILDSALKEPKVKSVVLTSSSTAAYMPQPNEKIIVTEDTWDDAAVEQAYDKSNTNAFIVYGASKTEGEREFWKLAKDRQVPFQVATVLPNANFGGEVLKPGGGSDASTGAWLASLWNGETYVYAYPPQYYINVDDNAKLHVIALTDPESNGKRLFGFAGTFTWNGILAWFRKHYPDRKFPDDKKNEGEDLSVVPNDKAEALLKKHYGHGWTSLGDTLKEAIDALVS